MEPRRHRWVGPLALSALLHLLLLLPSSGPDRPERDRSIEWELVYVEPTPAEPAPAEPAPAEPAPVVAAQRPPRPEASPSPEGRPPDRDVARPGKEIPLRRGASADTGALAVAQPGRGAPDESPSETDPLSLPPPAKEPGGLDADSFRRKEAPTLEPRLHLLDEAIAGPSEEAPGSGEADTNERLQGLLADDRAIERARNGRDGYWRDLARNMERRWQVDKEDVRSGPKLGLGFSVDRWIDTWRSQARAYALSGNPYGDGAFVRGSRDLSDRARPLQLNEKVVRADYEGGTNGTYHLMRVALVLVIQDDLGRVAEVRLQRSSGSRAYDEEALKAAQTLAGDDLGVPPQGRQSLWAFHASLAVTPPAPIVGCGIDAYFIPTECFYPLSEHLRSRVRLVGIWAKGEKPGLK